MKENQNYYALSVLLSKYDTYKMAHTTVVNSLVVLAINENEAKGIFITEIEKQKEYRDFKMGNIICIKVPREGDKNETK